MFSRIRSTLSSLAQNWAMTQKVYRLLPLEVAGFFLAGFVVIGLPVYLLLNTVTAILLAIPAGLLAATFWFSRRAMRAAYAQIDGQPGNTSELVRSFDRAVYGALATRLTPTSGFIEAAARDERERCLRVPPRSRHAHPR